MLLLLQPDNFFPCSSESWHSSSSSSSWLKKIAIISFSLPFQVTTLENGLKVASSDLSAPATTVGLYVATGSAFESVPGTAHILQQMVRDCIQSRTKG